MKFIEVLFDRFLWYRKWKGGKWECWDCDMIYSMVWYQVEEFTEIGGKRPSAICRGTPICEDWTKK